MGLGIADERIQLLEQVYPTDDKAKLLHWLQAHWWHQDKDSDQEKPHTNMYEDGKHMWLYGNLKQMVEQPKSRKIKVTDKTSQIRKLQQKEYE